MMGNIPFIGAGFITVMALIYDTDNTIKLVTMIIGVRGVTWLVKKVTSNISIDAAQIIDFTGWSIAGVSVVGVIGNAMRSVAIVTDTISKVSVYFEKIAEFLDRLVFWT